MDKKVFSIPIKNISFEDIANDQDDLVPVKLQICHDRENPNGSYFETDSLLKAKDSISNKPIVCAYEVDDDNEKSDFMGHEKSLKVNIDDNGKLKFKEIYIEQPIGVIPETNDYSIEEIDGYNWVTANGFLYKTYCEDAIEIIKNNDGTKKLSMEIEVLDGEEDTVSGFYHVKDFKFLGITLLGQEHSPAMGDNSQISLFSKAEQNEKFAMQFAKILEEVNKGGKKMTKEGQEPEKEPEKEPIKKEFSLSVNDLENRIREELSEFTYERVYSWGETETYNKYWLRDVIPTDNIVIVEDAQEYKNYGIPFIVNGDKVELKMEEAVRYIRGDWRVFEEGKDVEDSVDHLEMFNKISEKETQHFTAEIEKVKESFIATETEEYKALQADFAKVESEKESLLQFKANFEKQERERQEIELFTKYKDLEALDGFAEIKEKSKDFSIQDLENNLLLLFAKKNFSVKKQQDNKETNSLKVDVEDVETELTEAEKRYGKL